MNCKTIKLLHLLCYNIKIMGLFQTKFGFSQVTIFWVLFLVHLSTGFDFEQMEVEEVEPTKMIGDSWHKLVDRKRGSMLSFKVASNSDYVLER